MECVIDAIDVVIDVIDVIDVVIEWFWFELIDQLI